MKRFLLLLILLYLLTPFFDFLKKKSNLYKKERDSYNVNEFVDHSNEHLQINSFDTKDILQRYIGEKVKQLSRRIEPLYHESLQHMNNIENIALDLEVAKIDVEERSFESLLINAKRMVISSIKKEISSFPEVPKSFQDIKEFHQHLDSMVHRFSELSSSHKKVFNFFIRKYAERLENEFKNISSVSHECKREIYLYEDQLNFLNSSLDGLNVIADKKEMIRSMESLLGDKQHSIDDLRSNIKKVESEINSILNSEKYHNAQQTKQMQTLVEKEKKEFHRELVNSFSKVSRAFNKYSYGMNKSVIHKIQVMTEKPWEIFSQDIASYGDLIRDVKTSMVKRKINVKDSDKILAYIDNILDSLDEFKNREVNLDKKLHTLQNNPDLSIFSNIRELKEKKSYLSQELLSKETSQRELQTDLEKNKKEIQDLRKPIEKCLLELTGKHYSLQVND
jgi:chromosome segregation ATPase